MPKLSLKEMTKTAQRILEKNIFQPVGDSLIVYRMKLDQTAGGILLPDNQSPVGRGYGTTGLVLAIGPGKYGELSGNLIPMPCEKGDYVFVTLLA